MPELPEIETLKNCLETKVVKAIITGFNKNRDNLRYQLSDNLELETTKAQILGLRRRAKYLIIDLDNNNSIVLHLGMSGRFTLQPQEYQSKNHDHVIFYLDSGEKLVFNDPRRFGMIYSFASNLIEEKLFKNLGIEPLSDLNDVKYLNIKLGTRNIAIKSLLMDNKILVGIGNIYASESLFLAKIHPTRLGSSLTMEEIFNLVLSIKKVLTKAIEAGGTTLKDFVNGDSKPGYFQQELAVYGRENQQCLVCSGIVLKLKQFGRTSFYCELCQR